MLSIRYEKTRTQRKSESNKKFMCKMNGKENDQIRKKSYENCEELISCKENKNDETNTSSKDIDRVIQMKADRSASPLRILRDIDSESSCDKNSKQNLSPVENLFKNIVEDLDNRLSNIIDDALTKRLGRMDSTLLFTGTRNPSIAEIIRDEAVKNLYKEKGFDTEELLREEISERKWNKRSESFTRYCEDMFILQSRLRSPPPEAEQVGRLLEESPTYIKERLEDCTEIGKFLKGVRDFEFDARSALEDLFSYYTSEDDEDFGCLDDYFSPIFITETPDKQKHGRNNKGRGNKKKGRQQCFRCNVFGHYARDCGK